MIRNNQVKKRRESGAVLLLAMVFLLLLAIISGTVIQTSILEFRMAGNEQFQEEAFQKAQAVVEKLSENIAYFVVGGDVWDRRCDAGGGAGCIGSVIALDPNVVSVPSGVELSYYVERQGPLSLDSLPVRVADSAGFSATAYDVAIFEATATVDGTAVRLGSASVVKGMAVRHVASGQ
jgi:hypothetical protein